MYTPAHFAAEDADALIDRIAMRSAAILVTHELAATHLPILWDSARKIATGHIARANPQWKAGDGPGLMILAGPEAYVSPSCYPSKAEHGKVVPTWNYEAVHLTGRVEWFDDAARLEALVRALSERHEAGRAAPWTLEDAPRPYIEAMLRGIVGVALHTEKIEAKRKLSQNKSAADFGGVAAGLATSADSAAQEVGALMGDARAQASDADGN
jgi:transcriptional regulator